MFRNTLPSPLADTDVIEHPADLIPLSHLELDLPAPRWAGLPISRPRYRGCDDDWAP